MYRTPLVRLAYRSTLHGVDAFDPSTGHTAWSWATRVTPATGQLPPVRVEVRDGEVYFLGTTQHGRGLCRELVCLEGQSGAVRWRYNLEALYPSSALPLQLLFASDVVLVTSHGAHANTAGISRVDGRGLWARREPMNEPPVLSVEGESVHHDRTLTEP